MSKPDRRPVASILSMQIASSQLSRRTFLAGAVAGGAAILSPSPQFRADDAPAPKPGGRLRVGMFGGGASETLDPNLSNTDIDIARAHVLYERLVDFNPDGSLFNQLAEEFSPANGTMTASLKIRRRAVEEHCRQQIEKMYGESAG